MIDFYPGLPDVLPDVINDDLARSSFITSGFAMSLVLTSKNYKYK